VGNEARFIQRMCRANRLDYPCKVANVFVWSNDTDMDATLRATARVAGMTGRHPRVHRVSTDYSRAVEPAVDAALAARVEVMCVTVQEMWHRRLAQLETFIHENGRRPACGTTDTDVNRLGSWFDNQQRWYDADGPLASKCAMRTPTIHDAWTALIERYPLIFASSEDQWYRYAQDVEEFIIRTGKRPAQGAKDRHERKLGNWVNNIRWAFSKDGPDASKKRMRNPLVHAAWASLVGRHSQAFASADAKWYDWARMVRDFAVRAGKKPSQTNADQRIGRWVAKQINNHNPDGAAVSSQRHRTPEIHAHWAALVLRFPFLKSQPRSV
jgi:hypothetical protein